MKQTQDWRARRWEDTHQRIFDTAIRLFQENGFDQVSVGQIAAGAGVSVPTFYAHYQSKEHLVMMVPTAAQMEALLATQPADLPVAERIRRAAPLYFAEWTVETRNEQLARWEIIAQSPTLRTRAAEFERATAGLIADALPGGSGSTLGPADQVVVNACLAAYTAGLLSWADSHGERRLEDVVDEAFQALLQR